MGKLKTSDLTFEKLESIGFKAVETYTVSNSVYYELGRNRQISISCLGTPNEMVFILEVNEKEKRKIDDLVVLRNYDYDGYTSFEDLKKLIELITNKNCHEKH